MKERVDNQVYTIYNKICALHQSNLIDLKKIDYDGPIFMWVILNVTLNQWLLFNGPRLTNPYKIVYDHPLYHNIVIHSLNKYNLLKKNIVSTKMFLC